MAKRIGICNEQYNGIYLENTVRGYKIQPCCLYNKALRDDGERDRVDSIDEIMKANQDLVLTEDTCINCISKERHGIHSKRLESFIRAKPEDGLRRFDLRPGNTCNLKCAMCNPGNSSAWMQDINVWESFNSKYDETRRELDWDWIYSKCVDKADEIYVAGGEPFYMKTVQKFLKDLSNNPWNCENTELVIQTNGVSNTPQFLKTLSKFKKLHFGISIDGWEDVNELIRFPTKHDELMIGIQELFDCNPWRLDYTITVQAMNLLNVDTLVEGLEKNGFLRKFPEQSEPLILFNLRNPFYLSINCLKPQVIESCNVQEKTVKQFIKDYKYDNVHNPKMQKYLLELDKVRGTNSPKIMPWCFV